MRLCRSKAGNVDVSDLIGDTPRESSTRVERQLPEATQTEVELALETNPSIAVRITSPRPTVWAKGTTLRACESSNAFETSIDLLSDKLERQVKRYREKRSRRGTGSTRQQSCSRTSRRSPASS